MEHSTLALIHEGSCSVLVERSAGNGRAVTPRRMDALKEGADNRTYGERLGEVERLEVRGA